MRECCTFCGSPYVDDADFCHICGASTGLLAFGISEEDPLTKKPAQPNAEVIATADQLREGTAAPLCMKASSTDPTPFYVLLGNEGSRTIELVLSSSSNQLEFDVNGDRSRETHRIKIESQQRNVPVRLWITPPQGLDTTHPGEINYRIDVGTDGAQTRAVDVVQDATNRARQCDRRFEFPAGLWTTVPISLQVTYQRPPEMDVDQDLLLFTDYVHERQLTLINRGDSTLVMEGVIIPGHAELFDAEGNKFDLIQDSGQLLARIPDLAGHETRHLRVRIKDLNKIIPGETLIARAIIGSKTHSKHVLIVREISDEARSVPAAVFGIDFGTSNTSISYLELGPEGSKDGFVADRIKDSKPRTRWPSLFTWHRKRGWLFGHEAEILESGEDWDYFSHFQVRRLKTLIRSDHHEYMDEKYHRSRVKKKPIEGIPEDQWPVLGPHDIAELSEEEREGLEEIEIIHGPQDPKDRQNYLAQFKNEALLVTYMSYLHRLIVNHIVENPNDHAPFRAGSPDSIQTKAFFTLPVLNRDLESGGHNDKAMLQGAALDAGFHPKSFDWLLEPESAALYFVKNWERFSREYSWRGGLNHGDLVLIFDAGAGTTDVALLKVRIDREGASFETMGFRGGSRSEAAVDRKLEVYGGVAITDKVRDAMITTHGERLDKWFGIYDIEKKRLRPLYLDTFFYTDGNGLANKSWVTPEVLHITAENLKLRLNSIEGEGPPPDPAEADLSDQVVTMSRESFKKASEDILQRMVQLVRDVLSAKGNVTKRAIPAAQIKHTFLVGGTSNTVSYTHLRAHET